MRAHFKRCSLVVRAAQILSGKDVFHAERLLDVGRQNRQNEAWRGKGIDLYGDEGITLILRSNASLRPRRHKTNMIRAF